MQKTDVFKMRTFFKMWTFLVTIDLISFFKLFPFSVPITLPLIFLRTLPLSPLRAHLVKFKYAGSVHSSPLSPPSFSFWELIPLWRFNYHYNANDSQVSVSSPDLSPPFDDSLMAVPNLNILTAIQIQKVKNQIRVFPTNPVSPSNFPLSV